MQHGAVVPLPTLPARNRQHRLKANVRDLQFSLILGLFFLLLLLFFLQSNSAECCFCSIHPLDYSAAPERWFICKPSLALGSRGVLVCGLCCGMEGFVTPLVDVLLCGAVWLCCGAGDGCSGVRHFGAFLLLEPIAAWP